MTKKTKFLLMLFLLLSIAAITVYVSHSRSIVDFEKNYHALAEVEAFHTTDCFQWGGGLVLHQLYECKPGTTHYHIETCPSVPTWFYPTVKMRCWVR